MRPGRPKSLVLAFVVGVLLTAGTLQGLDLFWRRQAAIETYEVRSQRITKVVAEYIRGNLALADTTLRQLVAHGRRVGGANATSTDWQPILDAADAALPGGGSVSVTDAQGIIRHSTMAAIVGQSRRDHYAFQQLAANDSAQLIVDAPFRSPVTGRYVLPIARRLSTADGRFDGIIAAVINPEQAFRDFVRTVALGAEGAIWIFHPTGTVIFKEPSSTDPMGEQATDHPMFIASRNATEGMRKGPIAPDGATYVSAFRTMTATPLTVVVSLSEDEALESWREQRRTVMIEFAAFVFTVGVLVMILFRQMEARVKVERELTSVQHAEAQRLAETNAQLAAALQRETHARRESEEASRLKDEFLMTLSHELRTPLNAIVGWVRMLTAQAVPPERQRQALETIERNAAAQTRLVEDLLDVSRAITGKLQLDARMINPAEAVARAVDTLRPAMVAKRLTFREEVERDIPAILADPDRLQQIVWNLLSNAIKFTPEGGSVLLRMSRQGPNVEVTVTDTGIGITPEFLPFVFDRFRQADAGPKREAGGLGLGLAIVRQLVELHGGRITAESAGLDSGATFRVSLPAARSTS